MSVQKKFPEFGGGDHAGVLLAEPFVAVSGDEAVHGVAQEAGDDDEAVEQGPGTAEAAGDAEGGGGVCVPAVTFFEDDGVEAFGGFAVRFQEGLTGFRLQGREAEGSFGVAFDDEGDRSVAQVADAVEEDDGVLFWMFSSVAFGALHDVRAFFRLTCERPSVLLFCNSVARKAFFSLCGFPV